MHLADVAPAVAPMAKCEVLGDPVFVAKSLILLVPVERIELPTFGLQNRCSTAELNRLTH
jgi:hypothetical protein